MCIFVHDNFTVPCIMNVEIFCSLGISLQTMPPVEAYIYATLLLRLDMKTQAVEVLELYDKTPWNLEVCKS